MIIEKVRAKSLVNRNRIDDFWWSEGGMNPYQGCYHNCVYCDGKSEGYFMHEDFGGRIKVKINAPELLEKYLRKNGFFPVNRKKTSTLGDYYPSLKLQNKKRLRNRFILCVGGGVTDVYQPAERKMKITRRLLSILYDYDIPVQLLTKNKNVLRDIELIKKINAVSYANVAFSITLADDSVQQIFEPRASSTAERFDALKQIREAGIHGGVFLMPCLPWIGDTDENIKEIFRMARESKAEYVVLSGLTLKPGRNKDEYLATVKRNFPRLYGLYFELYGNNNKYGNPSHTKLRELQVADPILKGMNFGREFAIPIRMPRYIPKGRIRTNLCISTVLFRIAFLKSHFHYQPKHSFSLRKAAYFIETFNQDLASMSGSELSKLPIPKSSLPYILEYLEKGKVHYLESIDQANNLFYN